VFLKSTLLNALPWATHGFGTRASSVVDGASLRQIHSNRAIVADREGVLGQGDALVTNLGGLAISIRTADCYPILLADRKNEAIAAIHAGWRGTAARIVSATLERMKEEYETNPFDVVASIGPGIGGCCYEVGDEVAREFGFSGQTHLDLLTENRKQLVNCGVPAENIEALNVCTFCDAERFFSYRREKENAGRMTSFIRIALKQR
jgi:polyphenol oxidase